MRIALTITELDPGGAEQCLVHLAIFLHQQGHVVQVYALGPTPEHRLGSTPDRQRLANQLHEAGIQLLSGPARGISSLPSVVRWLRNELQQFAPDIIQSMLFHGNFVTALANRKLNIPHIGGARVRQDSRWRQWAQRWAAGRMRKLVCVSQMVADHCLCVERIPSDKLLVIPNGIAISSKSSTPPIIPAQLTAALPAPSTPYLLFVGRLSEQKGVASLIRHLPNLLQPLPEHHVILLGDGPLRLELEAEIQQSNYGDRVHLMGWQPTAIDWMRHAQLLLLPSRYEGMPNVVLEAMSVSIPVLTFPVEGIAELLPHDTTQVVHGDLSEFVSRAVKIAGDSPLRSRLSQENYHRVARDFQLKDQLAKYESIYLSYRQLDD